MTQRVTVLSVSGTRAKVIHHRPTACHGDCDHCEGGCGSMAARESLIVEAENVIGARPGDQVMIEGDSGKVASAILLVYVLPLILFFVGYFLGAGIGHGALCGIIGFVLGLLAAVLESRRQRKRGTEISFRIVSFASESSF